MRSLEIALPRLRQDIGLGGLVKKGLSTLGIKPCSPCKQREKALDDLLMFVQRKEDARR